ALVVLERVEGVGRVVRAPGEPLPGSGEHERSDRIVVRDVSRELMHLVTLAFVECVLLVRAVQGRQGDPLRVHFDLEERIILNTQLLPPKLVRTCPATSSPVMESKSPQVLRPSTATYQGNGATSRHLYGLSHAMFCHGRSHPPRAARRDARWLPRQRTRTSRAPCSL